MDVSTQTAICYLGCPDGVGVGPQHTMLPCALFWETDCDLLIGWGDSFRHVEVVTTPLPGGPEAGGADIVTARNVVDWEADCLICGLTTLDADHVLLLGYVHPLIRPLSRPLSRPLPRPLPRPLSIARPRAAARVRVHPLCPPCCSLSRGPGLSFSRAACGF